MPLEFGRKWGTVCLNSRFPLSILLCAGYSVKLIYFYFFILKQTNKNCNNYCFWFYYVSKCHQYQRFFLIYLPSKHSASVISKKAGFLKKHLKKNRIFSPKVGQKKLNLNSFQHFLKRYSTLRK